MKITDAVADLFDFSHFFGRFAHFPVCCFENWFRFDAIFYTSQSHVTVARTRTPNICRIK